MPNIELDEKSIFNAARKIESQDARREYVRQMCGEDVAQFDRITALLCGFEKDSQFLEVAAIDLTTSVALSSELVTEIPRAVEPIQIGPYTICKQIGEGGMGVVYLAEQTEPVRRKVALKIIKPGMDSKDVLARFDAERQALAMMLHPNIAKILDGGTTDKGLPYFVMELVKGVAITEFCDDQKLNLRERLELFVTVCQAVQHAHRKGIIHRDLKPSNILVESNDRAPLPKVIDFGIAKAINQQLTHQSIHTDYSQLVGTPLYMSPEQAQFSGLDVDTRSDVYSLGAVLYELLVGVPPFDETILRSVGLDELRRMIREDEPLRPSAKVSTHSDQRMLTISDQRKTSPRDLSLSMRGELEWILMRALEKDRSRRYESASALALDIQRYLNDEPVEAYPPSAMYRLKKFAQRNKFAIAAIGLVAASLIMGTSVSLWQAHQANDARRLADQRLVDAEKLRLSAISAAQQAQQSERFSRQLVYAADVRLAAQAWRSGDVLQFTELLDRHLPMTGETDLRGFEWRYLRQFGRAHYLNIAAESGGSSVVRFSPDGKYLVTGGTMGTIGFWDAQSDEHLATVFGHGDMVRGIDFAPDGIRMASIGNDGMIQVWDLAQRKPIRRFPAHTGHGYRVFFVQEGKMLASCGEDSAVRFWDSSTGESLGEIEDYALKVDSTVMDRSPDGQWFVYCDNFWLAHVWDMQSRKHLRRLDLGHRDGTACTARCVSISPDRQLAAVGTNQNLIRVCDVRTGEPVATLTGHHDDIEAVAFHPSGNLLASCDKAGVIRLWPLNFDGETEGGDSLKTDQWPPSFRAHSARIHSLDFSPDGTRLVSASKDGKVRSWGKRGATTQHVRQTGDETNATTFVRSVAGMQGNELLIAGDQQIRIWNRQTDEIHPLAETFDEPAMCVAISPDGQTCVSGHKKGMIRFWSRQTGQLTRTQTGHADTVDSIELSPDGRLLATASWDGAAKLWDVATGEQLAVFNMPPHCYDAAFSPDGRLLACSSEDNAMIFDVASRKRLHLLRGHENTAACVAFSPAGRQLATGSADRTIRIWSVDSGKVKHVIAAHRDEIYSLAFSPDGRTIASGGEQGTIAFSHVETGQLLFDTKVDSDRVSNLQFAPDGRSLAATVRGKGVLLLQAPSMETNDLEQPFSSSTSTSRSNDRLALAGDHTPPAVVSAYFHATLQMQTNLVINGDAEAEMSGWTSHQGEMATGIYAEKQLEAFPNSGSRYFRGDYNKGVYGADAIVSQTINLHAGAVDIDRENIQADLSASLGGTKDQRDCAIVQLQWKNDLGDMIRAHTLPTVKNVSRENKTMLLRRGLRNLPVPIGTRKVTVVMLAHRSQGKSNNGYWDNLSLTLHSSTTQGLRMVFGMKDGKEATVSAVIDGNKLRPTGPDDAFVLADEINPTGGLLIRTKSIAESAP